jgi:hypothetical protein
LPIASFVEPEPECPQRRADMTIRKLAILMALAVAAIGPLSCNKENGPVSEAVSNKDIYTGMPIFMDFQWS